MSGTRGSGLSQPRTDKARGAKLNRVLSGSVKGVLTPRSPLRRWALQTGPVHRSQRRELSPDCGKTVLPRRGTKATYKP